MSLSALPNELLHFILSELATPLALDGVSSSAEVAAARRDLSSCAMLSRRWMDAAQPLLFQDAAVALQNEHAEDPPEKTWRNFEAFVRSSPHLFRDTHTLRIRNMPIQYCKTEEQSSLPQEKLELDLHALASLLVSLQRLKRLILNCVDLFLPPQYSVLDLQQLNCTVEDFALLENEDRLRFALEKLFVFLAPFTSLRSLTLEHFGFAPLSPGEYGGLFFYPNLSHLKTLKLRNNKAMSFIFDVLAGGIINQDLLHCLEHLEIGRLHSRELWSLHHLLDHLSDRLRSLTLQLDRAELSRYYYQAFDFRALTRLTHLTLVVESPPSTVSRHLRNHVWRIVGALLDNPPVPPLERITLEYTRNGAISDPEARNLSLEHHNMHELELCLLELPTLRTLEFRPPQRAGYTRFRSQDREHVRNCFPELDAKGMLVV